MKKLLLIIIFVFFYNHSYSQMFFEKGYFIDNNNQKINCFIKNKDWIHNPKEFTYKLTEEGKTKLATIDSIKQFEIENYSKYVRSTVKIDRSSEELDKLSNHKEPIFTEEQLFLKVLIEGPANLYLYKEETLERFFYSTPQTQNIQQLVYKSYMINNDKIGENIQYKQQIWTDLNCSLIEMSDINNIIYRKNDLINYFKEYSECKNIKPISYKPEKDLFNLTLRPRINFSPEANFANNFGFGFGIETEFILPIHKNKWSIIVEPTYTYFNTSVYEHFSKSFTVGDAIILDENEIEIEINYSAIEIPIGVRHYIFLNETSKIFMNAALIIAINASYKPMVEYHLTEKDYFLIPNTIDYKPRSGPAPNLYSTGYSDTTINLGLGLGYKLYDKYSMEIRYQTNNELNFPESETTVIDYNTLSFILGYSFF